MKESEIIATLNRCSTRIRENLLRPMDKLDRELSAVLRDIKATLDATKTRIENEGVKK